MVLRSEASVGVLGSVRLMVVESTSSWQTVARTIAQSAPVACSARSEARAPAPT